MNATVDCFARGCSDYLESKALKNDPEAQAWRPYCVRKKYGHTLPTAFDMEVDTKILDLL